MQSYSNTDLGRLEALFNQQFNAQHGFYFRKLKVNQLKKWLDGKVDGSADTGITVHGFSTNKDGQTVNGKAEPVTFDDLQRFLMQAEHFNGRYSTPSELVQALYTAAKDNSKPRADAIAYNLATQSEAGKVLRDVTADVTDFKPIPLFTYITAVLGDISDADAAFTMKHFHKDGEGQLYWRFNNGVDYPLPIVEKDGRSVIAADGDFWDKWFGDNAGLLCEYMRAIHAYMDQYQTDAIDDPATSDDEPEFEAGLRRRVPSFVLNSVVIGKRLKKDAETGKTYCDGFTVRIKAGASPTPTQTRQVWQDILKTTLVGSLPVERLQTVKVFSNDHTAAIHRLHALPVRKAVPQAHPLLQDYGCYAWARFLRSEGPTGNTKFPSQRMGELRLAKAIYGIASASDYSRQILCCFGEGQDGKSVCFDAIAQAMGCGRDGLARTGLSQNIFDSQFGLWQCINRRLLVVDDIPRPFEFIEHDVVKRISGAGGGSMQVDRKNLKPYTWTVAGCKLVMATNNNMTLRSEATISRCLPLTFTRNYFARDQDDPVELTNALAAEVYGDGTDGNGLLCWAIDVLLYYTHVCNVKGERCPLITGHGRGRGAYPFDSQSVMVATDEMFDAWMAGSLDLLPDDVATQRMQRQQAYIDETTIKGRATSFVVISQDTGSETAEVASCFERVVKLLFRSAPGEHVTPADIADTVLTILGSDRFKACDTRLYLQACGLEAKNIKTLSQCAPYRQLLQTMLQTFGTCNTQARVCGRNTRIYANVALYSLDDIVGFTAH